MNIEKERKAFEDWISTKEWIYTGMGSRDVSEILVFNNDYQTYHFRSIQECWETWQASANREGYKLVPVDDINISDMIWGKCSCGSSRSSIISDREGYNLIHCFACGANKYIHEDY